MLASPSDRRLADTRSSSIDAVELLLGRTGWEWSDYVAAGEREFDAHYAEIAGPSPFAPGDRKTYAIRYAELACPTKKRFAARAAERARRGAFEKLRVSGTLPAR